LNTLVNRPGRSIGIEKLISSLLKVCSCNHYNYSTFQQFKKSNQHHMRLKLHAPWDEVRERLKESNVNLTDEDLQYEPGGDEELLERLSSKLGKDKLQTKALVESISSNRGQAG
jgi:hypothetical protein